MKQSNSRWAVNLTALVLAAGLLMGLFTGCFGLMGPKNDDTGIFKVTNYGIIYGYKCTKEELPANLVIPDKIGNKVITGIRRIAFYGCTGLTSIDLSGCTSLTEIGGDAFYGCTGLTEVKLPASLTEIDGFSDCTGLTSIDLSGCTNLTKIGGDAFKGCTGLTEVKLPASLTTIGNSAFFGCTKLASIDLSACTSLTEIGEEAFRNCSKLTGTIVFPASLTEIGWATFSGCTGLTEVKLPASLTKIGSSAFADCTNLNRAVFANTTGWAVYDVYSNNEHAGISSTSLDNAETAARYLRETYVYKYWKKN